MTADDQPGRDQPGHDQPGHDQPHRRRPRRAGRDRTAVLDAAVRVIAERGADATRFTDVATASDVPVSTLQYYFGSREDLLVAAFRHASETELAALRAELGASGPVSGPLPEAGAAGGPSTPATAQPATAGGPWERLVRIVDAALHDFPAFGGASGRLWIEAWRFALRDAEMRADVLADYAAWRELIAAAVRDGVAAGEFTTAMEPEGVAVLLLSLLDGFGMPLALADPAVPADQARASCLAALAAVLGTGR